MHKFLMRLMRSRLCALDTRQFLQNSLLFIAQGAIALFEERYRKLDPQGWSASATVCALSPFFALIPRISSVALIVRARRCLDPCEWQSVARAVRRKLIACEICGINLWTHHCRTRFNSDSRRRTTSLSAAPSRGRTGSSTLCATGSGTPCSTLTRPWARCMRHWSSPRPLAPTGRAIWCALWQTSMPWSRPQRYALVTMIGFPSVRLR